MGPAALLGLFSLRFVRILYEQNGLSYENGVPTGIRTPVLTVKGWCPRPG